MIATGTQRRRTVAIVIALLLAACAPLQPPLERFGGANDLVERIDVDPSDQPLTHVDVELSRAASVLVLYVVPGRGAAVLSPSPAAATARLGAGAQRISLASPSATAALRRASGLGGLGELVLFATEDPIDVATIDDRLAHATISSDRREAVADAARVVQDAAPSGAWSALSTRTWLLPSDAHGRGLRRMPRAQRAAQVF